MKPITIAVLLLVMCWLAWLVVPYFVASYEYEKLVEIDPETRAEAESILFLYRSRAIDIRDSNWGFAIKLEPGQYCQQYLIMGREPIDIVYNEKDQVVHILSSYE